MVVKVNNNKIKVTKKERFGSDAAELHRFLFLRALQVEPTHEAGVAEREVQE